MSERVFHSLASDWEQVCEAAGLDTDATANGKSYSGGHYDTPEEANEAVIRLRNRVQQNNRKDWDDEFTDD